MINTCSMNNVTNAIISVVLVAQNISNCFSLLSLLSSFSLFNRLMLSTIISRCSSVWLDRTFFSSDVTLLRLRLPQLGTFFNKSESTCLLLSQLIG